ncbi:MAG: SagB/ThcOx family dehydrogenase [Candidatus Heimdallarchaeota archaeon]|nr:SagB/ThcOx family dehydrogenase [Candidatus Heimdallarchaeota archaeon]
MSPDKILSLPRPQFTGTTPLEEAFKLRRTVRKFSSKELDLSIISQLLWALQGITISEDSANGKKICHRAAPSAGGSYPLRVYLAFSRGFYQYNSLKHELQLLSEKDLREKLSEAPFAPHNKEAIKIAPITIILTADNQNALEPTPIMENALRFVHLEAGHATQNLILQAVALELGVCTMTSYQINRVYQILDLPLEHRPIYLLPIGYPSESPSLQEK